MLDPADCGPAFLGLPQDVQAMAFDVPDEFLAPRHHPIVRSRPDRRQLAAAADALRGASTPLILAGGGVHYSFAETALLAFAERHGIPVVETVAGKASLVAEHPLNCGPIGVTGCESANNLAAAADVVLSVGCRLEDFTTGSWTLFQHPDVTIIGLNAARFDAHKRRSLPLVADAREGLTELSDALGGWRTDDSWVERAAAERAGYHAYIDKIAAPSESHDQPISYAQVVGVVDRHKIAGDYALAAAGGFPGEVNNGWRADEINSFDCEYGFSCMGYEIAGGWGAKMAMPDREVIVFVGDGSTMMMNSDLYSSVISGHKMIVIICDNGGFAVINRLQVNQGGVPFNNLLDDCKGPNVDVRVDFEMLARAQGCNAETVSTAGELAAAMVRARASDRTYVIALQTHPYEWTEGGTYWEVGVPEVSNRPGVTAAHDDIVSGKSGQRRA
jgi:3D-(3,5/4)-trihydroxycyclohexane-1,2-dione acylhydrolase (decyclizing)